MNKFLKTLIALGLVGCLLLSFFFYLIFRGEADGEVKDLLIPRGATLAQVSEVLHQNEVVGDPKLFKILLRLTRGNSKVRAGEFRFKTHMSALNALSVLYNDEEIVHQVTIPEGWTVRQIAEVIAAAKLVNREKFLELALSKSSATRYGLKTPTLEGFLYPDTYAFSLIDGEERIIDRMVQQFLTHYKNELRADAEAQGMSLETLVTLASVIEKETGSSNEREIISSVFHNRLKKGMRLQSDPTTIYGIANFNGNLTKADLLRYSPYNTYVINGLPPGPIANPGIATLKATLHPAKTEYLFFVSNNQGAHVFSKTYQEHARYVSGYQAPRSNKEPQPKKKHVTKVRSNTR